MYNWRNDPLPTHNRWNTPMGRLVKFVALHNRTTGNGSFIGIFIAAPIGILVRHTTGLTWAGIAAALAVWAALSYTLYRLAHYYGLIAEYGRKPTFKGIVATVVVCIVLAAVILL